MEGTRIIEYIEKIVKLNPFYYDLEFVELFKYKYLKNEKQNYTAKDFEPKLNKLREDIVELKTKKIEKFKGFKPRARDINGDPIPIYEVTYYYYVKGNEVSREIFIQKSKKQAELEKEIELLDKIIEFIKKAENENINSFDNEDKGKIEPIVIDNWQKGKRLQEFMLWLKKKYKNELLGILKKGGGSFNSDTEEEMFLFGSKKLLEFADEKNYTFKKELNKESFKNSIQKYFYDLLKELREKPQI